MKYSLQFQGAALLGAEGLPFVFKDEIAGPVLFPVHRFPR